FDQLVQKRLVDRAVIFVPDHQNRSAVARVEAFDLFDREHAVLCGLTVPDAELFPNHIPDSISAANVTRQARADLDLVPSRFVRDVVHGVERRDALNLGETASETVRDFHQRLWWQATFVLALGDPQGRQNAGFERRVVRLYRL